MKVNRASFLGNNVGVHRATTGNTRDEELRVVSRIMQQLPEDQRDQILNTEWRELLRSIFAIPTA